MYIHIGGDVSVRSSEVVAVMDIEQASTSKITKEFLRKVGKDVISVSEELPRTFIITKKKSGICVYISPISSATMCKRAEDGERKRRKNNG